MWTARARACPPRGLQSPVTRASSRFCVVPAWRDMFSPASHPGGSQGGDSGGPGKRGTHRAGHLGKLGLQPPWAPWAASRGWQGTWHTPATPLLFTGQPRCTACHRAATGICSRAQGHVGQPVQSALFRMAALGGLHPPRIHPLECHSGFECVHGGAQPSPPSDSRTP